MFRYEGDVFGEIEIPILERVVRPRPSLSTMTSSPLGGHAVITDDNMEGGTAGATKSNNSTSPLTSGTPGTALPLPRAPGARFLEELPLRGDSPNDSKDIGESADLQQQEKSLAPTLTNEESSSVPLPPSDQLLLYEEVEVHVIRVPIALSIIPPPRREQRILFSQYHNLQYPPAYIPRDRLEVSARRSSMCNSVVLFFIHYCSYFPQDHE